MPVRTCLFCGRPFLLENEQSPDEPCSRCPDASRAMAGREPAVPTERPDPLSLHAPESRDSLRLGGVPWGGSDWGRRMLIATTEAAGLRACSRSLRSQARTLRGATELLPPGTDEAALAWLMPVSPLEPEEMSGPGPANGCGERLDPEILRACQLSQQARALVERARSARLCARITRGIARATREDVRRRASLSLDLPPLDYILLPPGAPLPALVDDAEEPASDLCTEMPPAWLPPAPSGGSVTLFVWGYEPPRSLFCREQCESTAAAAEFAARAGWEGTRPGAWAREITLPCGLTEALRGLKTVLRQDSAVAGWGVHRRRAG